MIKNFRAQSAVEYLTTYGWAILIIAIIFVLFFILVQSDNTLTPMGQPGTCMVYRPNGANSSTNLGLVGECSIQPTYIAALSQSTLSSVLIPLINKNYKQMTLTFWFGPDNIGKQPQNIIYVAGPTGTAFYIYWTNDPVPPDEPWEFVTMSMNTQTQMYSFYVNDALVKTGAIGTVSVNSINIGGAIPARGLNALNGDISDVQLYNTTLSSDEMSQIFIGGVGGPPTDLQNLIGWWELNGNIQDSSGNGDVGMATNVLYTGNWGGIYTQP